MNTNQLSLSFVNEPAEAALQPELVSSHRLEIKFESTRIFVPQVITSSKCLYTFFLEALPHHVDHRESMIALYLSRSNSPIGYAVISIGGLHGTLCDPKVVFQHALLANASGIILCHNHPSGNLKPSKADRDLTRRMKDAGQFLDIQILDHVIITSEDYYSFADNGDL